MIRQYWGEWVDEWQYMSKQTNYDKETDLVGISDWVYEWVWETVRERVKRTVTYLKKYISTNIHTLELV